MKKVDFLDLLDSCPILMTDRHEYYHPEKSKIKFSSMSRVLDSFVDTFDEEKVSYFMAMSQSGTKMRDDIFRRQSVLLNEWDQKKNIGINFGNLVHSNLESQFKNGFSIDPEWQKLCSKIHADYMSNYQYILSEKIVWDKDFNICGTIDRMSIRSYRSDEIIVDITDTKTNLDKETRAGIRFTSDKFMLPPFDYLHECEYIRDCLQLSGYAYMVEKTFGFKIGMLNIEHIKNSFDDPIYLPVPYMRLEAEMMFKSFRSKNISLSKVTDDEDW